MTELYRRRRLPFAVTAAVLLVLSVAIARLPQSLVNAIETQRPFTGPQAGWAYRLLAFAAVAQAFYGGYVILRIDRVKRTLANDPKFAALSHESVIGSLSRNAAGMVVWTFVYGVASFGVTGQRGGFWLFPFLCLLQGAWYFREIGAIARWLGLQVVDEPEVTSSAGWQRDPPDYCPPLARILVDRTDLEPGSHAQTHSV